MNDRAMFTKERVFKVIALTLSLVFSLCVVLSMIFVATRVARATTRNVSPVIRQRRIVQALFLEQGYKRLMEAVTATNSDTFSTIWDFDRGVVLSKSIFTPTEMFGVMKYQLRPNVGVYNIVVWSGLHFQKLSVEAAPEVTASLENATVFHRVYFETDDNGFKKTEFASDPGSGTVFLLGDSFTEGLWVASENTFVNLFGRKLKSDKIPATPINLGVNGYSALEMYWMLERYGPSLNPKVVIVNLFPNDVHADYNDVVMGKNTSEHDYEQMFDYLQRTRDYCEVYDIRLIVAVIPPKSQLRELREFSVFQDRVKAWSEARGITFLDPRNYFDQFGADEVYFSWDPHFSVEGHKHYADFLYEYTLPIVSAAFTP